MNVWGDYMYKYSNKTIIMNFVFAGLLLFLLLFVNMNLGYRVVIGVVALMIIRDALNEKDASFELVGDRLIIRKKDKIIREIAYRDMMYLTITRKNKKWAVIADDEKILFTIKPRIENYEMMVTEIIEKNKSNKKLDVHNYIQKTYKK